MDYLVCLGGGGTAKSAFRLAQSGVKIITLPKTIDNDVAGTDFTFGYDTALGIATEAIDRLHTTATSHHRIIVCEVMGHRAGWLTLGAGLAGGADVILIPEIPYDLKLVARYILERRKLGKRFSIIAVAEGARSRAEIKAAKRAAHRRARETGTRKVKASRDFYKELWRDETRDGLPLVVRRIKNELMAYHVVQEPMSSRIARDLQELTGVEARVTTLGHVQRGGVPSCFDRLLCTLLGTKAAQLIAKDVHNVMVAYRGEHCVPVPLEKVAGYRKTVPLDHPMVLSARLVGTCLGDR
jgi:6-phosphofructokinase 1